MLLMWFHESISPGIGRHRSSLQELKVQIILGCTFGRSGSCWSKASA